MTKEARKEHHGEMIASVNGVGKTGKLHAKESSWTTFSHNIQK